MRRAQYSVLGSGNNGIVIQARPGVVYKYTRDPVEVASWLATASLQQQRWHQGVPGLPQLYDLHLGDRAAVVTREDVKPLGKRHGLDPYSIRALQVSSRLHTRSRLHGDRRAGLQARRIRSRGLYGPLRGVGQALGQLARLGAYPSDLRPDNFGLSSRGLLLHDPGRSPVETTVARSKGQYNKCPDARKMTTAVRELIGREPSYKSCRIVNPTQLQRVMQAHGWRDQEISDTAGFHSQDNVIYLLQGNEWSQLHELVHAAGIVDKDIAPWATEGITEAVAEDIAKKKKWKHHSTYPAYVTIVRKQLAPALGLTVLQIGQIVAAQPARAGRNISERLATRHPGTKARTWYKGLSRGVTGPEPFQAQLKKIGGR